MDNLECVVRRIEDRSLYGFWLQQRGSIRLLIIRWKLKNLGLFGGECVLDGYHLIPLLSAFMFKGRQIVGFGKTLNLCNT